MIALQNSKVTPLNIQQMSSFMGGRREIQDSYSSAYATMYDLKKDGYNPSMHKLTDGRYCIEW
ncbi:MAG: hypothetical protein R3E32_22820 [Chitinophagales bacterium]